MLKYRYNNSFGGGASYLGSSRNLFGVIKLLKHSVCEFLKPKSECYNNYLTSYFLPLTNRKTAFTLAEVLITIGIIGIVAAMLLPGVMTNLERVRNAAILRRAYSDLAIYVNKFAQENECSTLLTDCTPNWGQFVWEFSKYLHEMQKFVEVDSRCKGKDNCYTWFLYRQNGQSGGISLGQVYSIVTPYKSYYLESPTGLYAYFISVHMYDNYYNIHGDTFRARIHIITDMKRRGYFANGFGDDGKGNRTYTPQLGRNMFEAYVMNSKRVLPNGTSLCGGIGDSWAYYCHSLDSSSTGNCSYESGDFTACLQRVIDDGWRIKYRY